MEHRLKRLLLRGSEFYQAGDLNAAQACFESAVARDPDSGAAWFRLSQISARRGQFPQAVSQARRALALDGDRAGVLAHLARCQVGAGLSGDARKAAETALELGLRDGDISETLAIVFARLGDRHQALALFDRLIDQHPRSSSARYNRALVLIALDRLSEAASDLRACLQADPLHIRAHLALATLRRDGDHEHAVQLQELLRVMPANHPAEEALALALHHELDRLDRIDEAWTALKRALATRKPRTEADIATQKALFAALAAPEKGDGGKSRPSEASAPVPIMVVGMHRSGCELLAQLLARNEQLRRPPVQGGLLPALARICEQGPAEALDNDLLARIRSLDPAQRRERLLAAMAAAAEGSAHVLFARPLDFQLVGLILESVPETRVLHVQRDPRDVCFSVLANLSPFSAATLAAPANADAGQVAGYIGDYEGLMRAWVDRWPSQVMDVPYETLVAKPEMLLRVICAFVGLRFDPQSLAGKDLNTRRIGHWRRYQRYLDLDAMF